MTVFGQKGGASEDDAAKPVLFMVLLGNLYTSQSYCMFCDLYSVE